MRGGRVTVTEDGVVLTSGKPVRVYGASITSGAGGAAQVAFHNGTDATGNLDFQATGVASKTVAVANIPEEGAFFPAGLYLNVDSNTTSVTVWCEKTSN